MRMLLNTAFGLEPKPTTSIVRIFIGWLQHQIDRRRVRVNAAGSFVHHCTDGVLISSPAVFKAFVEDRAVFAQFQTAETYDWKNVQRVFVRQARKLMSNERTVIRKFRFGKRARLSGYVLRPGVVQLPINCPVNFGISETNGDQS